MSSITFFENTPFAFQIEHATPDCTCRGKVCIICKHIECAKTIIESISYCRTCWQEYGPNWYARHPKKRREESWRKQGINLTYPQFLEMLLTQNYQCKICRVSIDTSANVDHNHETGKLRGILCHRCNKAIGLFSESISVLESALAYMKM
jgi:hypothetical protein